MKLYWPMAISADGERHHTYDSCLSTSECSKVFACWEDGYHWLLTEMWIDVTDTEDPEFRQRVDVKKDYLADVARLSKVVSGRMV